jgi:sterol desaturase/sphingolipid hydroxylase (fatty acid hydroxylase superfamily)
MNLSQITELMGSHQIMRTLAYIGIFNLAITVFEVFLDLFTRKERRWKDSGANVVIFFVNQILSNTVLGALFILFLVPFQYLSPFSIAMNGWTWVLAIVVADFSYYWMHRLEHEHRFLWALHNVHHSSEDYNYTVGLRLSVLEPLVEWIFLVPMVLLGFSPFQAVLAFVLVSEYQHWIHTERIVKLGWLDEIFNTPSVHRVHHGSNEKYLDKNYGGILMIWDKLFGTFQREEEKVVYGLVNKIGTNNPWRITFIELQRIAYDVRKCRNWRDRLRIIFGGLKWRPDYFPAKENSPVTEQINAAATDPSPGSRPRGFAGGRGTAHRPGHPDPG